MTLRELRRAIALLAALVGASVAQSVAAQETKPVFPGRDWERIAKPED